MTGTVGIIGEFGRRSSNAEPRHAACDRLSMQAEQLSAASAAGPSRRRRCWLTCEPTARCLPQIAAIKLSVSLDGRRNRRQNA